MDSTRVDLLLALEKLGLRGEITPLGAGIVTSLLDSQYDALAVLDKELRFIFVNKNFETIIGLKPSEVIGRTVTSFVDNGIFEEAPALQVINTKQVCTSLHKSSTGAEVLITASPVLDDSGDISFIVDNIRDVTDLNRLREESLSYFLEKSRYEKEALELRAMIKLGDDLIVRSKPMGLVAERAVQAACVDANVLITGESGVGKGVLAKFIHTSSSRSAQSLVLVNCSAIPDSLLESELFGYEEGAFSGARRRGKPGLIEVADGGTLFLDEIGDMPLAMQAKLLSFLQERYFYRVGGVDRVEVDVRVIAATHGDIEQRIKLKEFREDFYYRLNVIPIHVPPLRERRDDIIPMANEFVKQFNKKHKKNKSLTHDAQYALLSYYWPGNVRELQNTIERLVILTDCQQINSDVIEQDLAYMSFHSSPAVHVNNLTSLPQAQKLLEHQLLEAAASQFSTARQIARALGVTHPTISKKLRQYGIKVDKT